jgi:hypothetical protein
MNLRTPILVVFGHLVAAIGIFWAISLPGDWSICWSLCAGSVVLFGVSIAARNLYSFSKRLYPFWLGTVLTLGFGTWTVYLCQDGFNLWALVTGFFILIGLCAFGYKPRKDPFTTGESPPQPTYTDPTLFDPRTPYDHTSGPVSIAYDTFVSYKSEDIHVVRVVAEQLLSAGYTPWFAEYLILLQGRNEFQAAIDQGTTKSRSGIAFTNDRYAGSKHTMKELRQLLGAPGCGIARLVEIRMPSGLEIRKRFPELDQPHRILDSSGDVNQILRFLRELPPFDRLAESLPTQDLRTQRYFEPNLGYTLHLGGWWIKDLGGREIPLVGEQGPTFEAVLGGRKARGTLSVGPVPGLSRDPSASPKDQRHYFDSIIEFADFYTKQTGRQCAGVHLIHDGEYSQFAVTYWADKAWVRKYAIDLPHPVTKTATEFSFTFAFFGPFREFCRYACLFDSIVTSLKWGSANEKLLITLPSTTVPFAYVLPDGWTVEREENKPDRYYLLAKPGGKRRLFEGSQLNLLVVPYPQEQEPDKLRHVLVKASRQNLEQQGAIIIDEEVGKTHGVFSHDCYYRQGIGYGFVAHFVIHGTEFVVRWYCNRKDTFDSEMAKVRQFIESFQFERDIETLQGVEKE